MKKSKIGQRKIVLAIVLIIVVGGIFYLQSTKKEIQNPAGEVSNVQISLNSGRFPRAPELAGISGYLNTDGKEIKISDYRGKVVLIDFWTYSCINCIRTLPYLTAWDEKYRDDGLVIIGVHTPEFGFEEKRENVADAIEKYGIEYAVVQDNNYATWNAYENRYWPRKYLIDIEGLIRYDHAGEGAYEETELVIQQLLSEAGTISESSGSQELGTLDLEEKTPTTRNTPELYAGFNFALSRGQNVGNFGGLSPGNAVEYSISGIQVANSDVIYLDGTWKSNPDDLELVSSSGSIILNFVAKSANIVLGNVNENRVVEVDVFIDGEYVSESGAGSDVRFGDGERAYVVVDRPDLYNVFDGDYGRRTLELRVPNNGKGFNFNAFTFG